MDNVLLFFDWHLAVNSLSFVKHFSFDVHCHIVIIIANKTPELLCRSHSASIKEIKRGHYQTLECPQHKYAAT